jgi:crossover junction endodeoxyribonuclease RuvC
MSTAYIGIDPGLSGAIAIIALDPYQFGVVDVPLNDGQYDFYQMYKLLSDFKSKYTFIWLTLEQQQAMPKQGVSSTFKTGMGYGAWRAICSLVTPDFEIVSPRKWKNALGLTSDKEASRKLAIKLYPNLHDRLTRKKDHNRAEAVLLAHYTREVWRERRAVNVQADTEIKFAEAAFERGK